MELNKPAFSRSTRKSSHFCKICDGEDANESKNKQYDKSLTANNHKVHYRQKILSEYFPMQEENKSCVEESKSATVIVNFRKLVGQLLNAKVMVERLSQAAVKAILCPAVHINNNRLQLDSQQPKGKLLKDSNNHSKDKTYFVRHYCYKCKTSRIDRARVCYRNKCKCHECGTHLLYICNKCNKNLYQRYNHMHRHQKLCNGQEKSISQGLKSMELYYCADCEFVTAFELSMKWHVSRTQHRVHGSEKLEGID